MEQEKAMWKQRPKGAGGEVMREIKKQIYLRWDEFISLFCLEIGFFLFGEIMLAIVIRIAHENEVFELGTLLAIVVPFFMDLFVSISSLASCFNYGISMCDTRKRLLPVILATTFLECFGVSMIAWLFHGLESWILRVFYPGMRNELSLSPLFQWKYILVACIVLVAIQALFGMLFLRFGKIALWSIWAIWMILCLGSTRLADFIKEYKDSVQMQAIRDICGVFSGLTETGLLVGISGICVLIILLSCFFLRKQQVTL